ncbi:hypothetical protein ACIHFE_24935 [Streptomyces sp. NPDC052396]|uniref:hypothetical protein n=1 Tax=Streptomyces sp. NPDC052396 TaxID=3365689 RepID=UPI0037CEEAAC
MSTPHSQPQPQPLHLADTPGYPLARTVEMPEAIGYPTGSLSIRLGALQLRAEGRPEAVAGQAGTYRIPALVLTGRYALDARPDGIRDLDTAGNLRPLSAEARRPTLPAASRTPAPHDPPEPDTLQKWRDRADAHRDKLMRSENGQQLLIKYGQHNESYYDAFDDPDDTYGLRQKWREKGTTRRMSEQTYATTDPQAAHTSQPAVNDWQDAQTGVAYNAHAFTQQNTLATVLSLMAEDATDPEKQQKYTAAALETINFAKTIGTTGNTDKDTTPMSQSAVYTAINEHTDELPTTTEEELARHTALAYGTYALTEEDEPEDWLPLSPEQRTHIRSVGRNAYRLKAQRRPAATDTLHLGSCSARLEDIRITMDPAREDAVVTLPSLALNIEDESWRGPVGEVARERLRTMRFVQELLRDAIAETVRHAALTRIPGYAPPQDGRS